MREAAYIGLCLYSDTTWLPDDSLWAIHYNPGDWVRRVLENYKKYPRESYIYCGNVSRLPLIMLLKAASPLPDWIQEFLARHGMQFDDTMKELFEKPPDMYIHGLKGALYKKHHLSDLSKRCKAQPGVPPSMNWTESKVNGFHLQYLPGDCEDCINRSQLLTIKRVLKSKKSEVESLIGSRGYKNIDIYIYNTVWTSPDSSKFGAVIVNPRTKKAWIRIYNGLSNELLKWVVVHEYSHYLQMSGTNNFENPLWMEGTSMWTEWKIYPESIKDDIREKLHFPNSIMLKPESGLFNITPPVYRRAYSGFLFLWYIEHAYGENTIKSVWQRCWRVPGDNTLSALVSTFTPEGFKRLYQNFMIANYFKDYEGINTSGWPATPSEWAFLSKPYINVTSDFDMINRALEPLGTHYIMFVRAPHGWDSGFVYVKVKCGEWKSGTEGRASIVGLSSNGIDKIYYLDKLSEYGEDERIKYYDIDTGAVLVLSNVTLGSNNEATFGYRVSVVPEILHYTISKPTYTSGDTIEIEVEISDTVFWNGESLVRADFTSIDNNFTDSKVEYLPVSGNERKVKIRYIIPDSARSGEYEIPIKAYDRAVILEHLGNHIPNEVKVKIRIDNLPRIKKTKVKHTDGKDSRVPINYNEIEVVFNKPMDSVSVYSKNS